MRSTAALLSLLALVGCASTAEKMIGLQSGMTKDQAIAVMGPPTSVSAQGAYEYLAYNLCIESCMGPLPLRRFDMFFVRLVSGRVESFGRTGDFDSTKTPTTRIQVDSTERVTKEVRATSDKDVYAEIQKAKDLLDKGAITQTEFDERKKLLLSR